MSTNKNSTVTPSKVTWEEKWKFIQKLLKSDPSQWRYIPSWLLSFRQNDLINRAIPWLTFSAIDYIHRTVKPSDKVFEYGSGGSTLFWLKQGASCVSIEHDTRWNEKIRLMTKKNSRLDYRLITPTLAEHPGVDISDPDQYLSDDPPWKGYSFRNYASQIDTFPDDFFDWVLVDGRARPSCIQHGIKKVRLGGRLILDNSDRPYYLLKTDVLLQGCSRKIFKGLVPGAVFVSETSIFVRTSK